MSVAPYYNLADAQVAFLDGASALLNGKAQTPHEVHCAYILLGYGLSVAVPDTTATPAVIANHVTAAMASGGLGSILAGLPWSQIIGVVLQIISTWQGQQSVTVTSGS